MFWFPKECIYDLIEYCSFFTNTVKNNISNQFLNGAFKLYYDQRDYQIIYDNEINYILTIDENNHSEELNEILNRYHLMLEGNAVINNNGAFSFVSIEQSGEKSFIKKQSVDGNSEKHLANEYKILTFLSELEPDYFPRPLFYSPTEHYYTMDIAFESLETYINERDISLSDRIQIANIILEETLFIHNHYYLHRDLKPNNILLFKNNKTNKPLWKIADFGLACRLDDVCKEFNKEYYGDPDYAAPEQLKDLSFSSIRSDIYSLGKVINFIFTRDPFNYTHIFKEIAVRCTEVQALDRFSSIEQILDQMRTIYP